MVQWIMTGAVLVQERGYEWGWGKHPMSGVWGVWGIGMMFFMLLFWGLVLVGVVLGIRWLISQGKETRSDSALEIPATAICARGDQQGRV
jgi:uncharacterized membrane protein